MKPAPFRYERPGTLGEALELLSEHGEEAKVLAGGQSLVPLLNMRLARPAVLVDINRVVDSANVARTAAGARVPMLVRQTGFAGVSRLADLALPYVGHVVTRNRGTVCGSIAHADARAELPLALTALAGSVVAASASGRRAIPAGEFFVTHFTTTLRPDELVVETVWPDPGEGAGCAFEELALRSGDYAIAMAACVLRVRDGRVESARVAIGGPIDRPTLLETGLAGRAVTREAAREAGAVAAAAVDPVDGLHASAAYQRHVTGLLVERAVVAAWADATGGRG